MFFEPQGTDFDTTGSLLGASMKRVKGMAVAGHKPLDVVPRALPAPPLPPALLPHPVEALLTGPHLTHSLLMAPPHTLTPDAPTALTPDAHLTY